MIYNEEAALPFEVRPLPRFTFTSERRRIASLAKKAVEILAEASNDTSGLDWSTWAKQAGTAIAKSYNIQWKVAGKESARAASKIGPSAIFIGKP